MTEQKQKLPGLVHTEYEHPFDRAALQALEATPGLNIVLEKIFKYGLENIQRVELTGSHVKVTPNCFPRIHRLFIEAAEILEIDHSVIDLYLVGNMSINAYTTGVDKPIIAVHTWTVDMMTEEELQYVIGHELGHIKSRHVLYKTLASVLGLLGAAVGDVTLGVGALVSKGLQIPLMHWSRMAEFTCDRAGLLVAQNIGVANTANMKIAGIPFSQKDQMNIECWRDQAREFMQYDYDTLKNIFKLWALYNPDTTMSHPFGVMRAAELEKWVDDGSYDAVIRRETAGTAPSLAAGGVVCQRCGSPVGPQTRFCTACGNDCRGPPHQVQGRFCIACGYPLNGTEKFCIGCGAACPGTEQVQSRFCIACGYPLTGSEEFCPGCGQNQRTQG